MMTFWATKQMCRPVPGSLFLCKCKYVWWHFVSKSTFSVVWKGPIFCLVLSLWQIFLHIQLECLHALLNLTPGITYSPTWLRWFYMLILSDTVQKPHIFNHPLSPHVSSPAPLKRKWSPVEQKGCCVKLWMGSPLKPSWHSQACLHSTTVTEHTTMRTWCLETQYKQII